MKKALVTALMTSSLFLNSIGQSIFSPSQVNPEEEFENVYREVIYSDSLSSSFLLIIKKGVGLHKHEFHSEHVYVLSGTGEMTLGEDHISIAEGDVLIIPKNTPHSLEVTSRDPMRAISFQSPKYVGKDQVFIE